MDIMLSVGNVIIDENNNKKYRLMRFSYFLKP